MVYAKGVERTRGFLVLLKVVLNKADDQGGFAYCGLWMGESQGQRRVS